MVSCVSFPQSPRRRCTLPHFRTYETFLSRFVIRGQIKTLILCRPDCHQTRNNIVFVLLRFTADPGAAAHCLLLSWIARAHHQHVRNISSLTLWRFASSFWINTAAATFDLWAEVWILWASFHRFPFQWKLFSAHWASYLQKKSRICLIYMLSMCNHDDFWW